MSCFAWAAKRLLGGVYFINPNSNYAVANPSTVISNLVDLNEATLGSNNTQSPINPGSVPVINFLAVDVPISAATASCPSSSGVSCSGSGLLLNPSNPDFNETIACANSQQLSCGQTLTVDPNSGNNPSNPGHINGQQAVLCLTHAGNTGNNQGQDQFCNNSSFPSCPSGSPN